MEGLAGHGEVKYDSNKINVECDIALMLRLAEQLLYSLNVVLLKITQDTFAVMSLN